MAVEFKLCESVIGAEVKGVSLRRLPDKTTIEAVKDGLEHYGVLIFSRSRYRARRASRLVSRLGSLRPLTQGVGARLHAGGPNDAIVRNFQGVSEDIKRKIAWDNVKRLYHMDSCGVKRPEAR